MSLFFSNLRPATVQRARVLDVDTRNYTLTVSTEYTQKPLSGISFASPYMHPNNGEGVYVMPEVGSICWLMEPSDGGMPFVVAWCPLEEQAGGYRDRRLDLNPGDIYLGTRDENHILLRRGGVVEIGATPLAQRLFIPIDNVIKDLCANYSLQTLGGELEWSVAIPESTTDGKRPTSLVLHAREFADDQAPVATVQIGSHSAGDPTILSLVLRASGAKGAATKISVSMKKTGDLALVAKGKVNWTVTGDVQVEAENVTIKAKTKASLIGTQTAELQGGLVNITSLSGAVAVAAQGGMVVSCPGGGIALRVGKGLYPVLLATPTFLAWLRTHTHTSASPGQQTSPPSIQPPLQPANDLKAS